MLTIWLQDFDNLHKSAVKVNIESDNSNVYFVDQFHPLHKDVCKIYNGKADKDMVYYVEENISSFQVAGNGIDWTKEVNNV